MTEIWWVKILGEDTAVAGTDNIDSWSICGGPHTAQTTAKINEAKEYAPVLLSI